MDLNRRSFLFNVAPMAGLAMTNLVNCRATGPLSEASTELIEEAGSPYLALPRGFQARRIQSVGERMTDSYRVPGAPDAMGVFPGANNTWVLMRNHEVGFEDFATMAMVDNTSAMPTSVYDKAAGGGVSRVVLDRDTLEVKSSNMVLGGTIRNCAGGLSPWGWMTCEETMAERHGYVFLCDPNADTLQDYKRIPSYGRFNHEACVVEESTHIAYLTEDRYDSCFYRFVPNTPNRPFEGTLQALKVVGKNKLNTSNNLEEGAEFEVEWVDVTKPDPQYDNVRYESQDKGATIFRRGEGLWIGGGKIYFSCTSGGPADAGQIFEFTPDRARKGGRLKLIVQSKSKSILDMPDNITISPQGELFAAEDGSGSQYICRIDRYGKVHKFAKNIYSGSEFAGVCFTPDGKGMFVNIQHNGVTLLVTGPFHSLTSS